jgi:hypothetical protein
MAMDTGVGTLELSPCRSLQSLIAAVYAFLAVISTPTMMYSWNLTGKSPSPVTNYGWHVEVFAQIGVPLGHSILVNPGKRDR